MSRPALILVFLTIFASLSPTKLDAKSQDLLVAIEEMQRATYYTYVVLLNIAPENTTPIDGNITFLMPHDRLLANTSLAENHVSDFLLRHSIPTPLLFDYLQHFPTSSIIPSSKPDFMLRVLNNGRRHFYLNNVRITSPNICTASSSIRCHGIDGVIVQQDEETSTPPPPPDSVLTCSNATSPPVPPPTTPPAPAALPAPDAGGIISTAPPPMEMAMSPVNSGSSRQFKFCCGLCHLVITCLLVARLFPI